MEKKLKLMENYIGSKKMPSGKSLASMETCIMKKFYNTGMISSKKKLITGSKIMSTY